MSWGYSWVIFWCSTVSFCTSRVHFSGLYFWSGWCLCVYIITCICSADINNFCREHFPLHTYVMWLECINVCVHVVNIKLLFQTYEVTSELIIFKVHRWTLSCLIVVIVIVFYNFTAGRKNTPFLCWSTQGTSYNFIAFKPNDIKTDVFYTGLCGQNLSYYEPIQNAHTHSLTCTHAQARTHMRARTPHARNGTPKLSQAVRARKCHSKEPNPGVTASINSLSWLRSIKMYLGLVFNETQ